MSTIGRWDTDQGCYGELLPTGNLLYAGKDDSGPLADLEGAGGILLEADWEGKVTWEYRDPFMHHAFYRMKNGNTLVSQVGESARENCDKGERW